MSLEIREISTKDVEAFTTLMQQVFEESKYMLYDPGEYVPSLEYAISNLEEVITSPHLAILVAEKNDMLVGYITIVSKRLHRIEHKARITMGVLNQEQGFGIGQSLIHACKNWCKAHDMSRIELTVVTDNKAAVHLYEREGFKIEGELQHSLKIDTQYFNEYLMAYLLD